VPVWVSRQPIWALALIFVGGGVLVALSGLWVVRKYVIFKWRIDQDDSEFSGALLQGILVFYGLAIALIALAVWQHHDDVANDASEEASAIGQLYRDVSLYPEPVRTEARQELYEYTTRIVEVAWPAAARGSTVTGGTQVVDQLQATLGAFEPATGGQQALQTEVLAQFNDLVEARRLRLDAVGTSLPGVFWGVVLGGAVLAVAASYFFQVEDVRLHATLVAILAAFIGLVLLLIVAYEHPFVGDLAVRPDSYQLILDDLVKPGG
jgi:MFS family permease